MSAQYSILTDQEFERFYYAEIMKHQFQDAALNEELWRRWLKPEKDEDDDFEVSQLRDEVEELEEEVGDLEYDIEQKEKEINRLKDILFKNGIEFEASCDD